MVLAFRTLIKLHFPPKVGLVASLEFSPSLSLLPSDLAYGGGLHMYPFYGGGGSDDDLYPVSSHPA